LSVAYSVLMFLVAFGILVLAHELGHYLVARYLGVQILRFSIGFGPIIARFCHGKDKTEWVISLIPLGGYVKMADTRDAPVDDETRAFDKQPVQSRMLIAAAGPIANFLFALLAYWVIGVMGFQGIVARLGSPAPDTPAAVAGFQSGDTVIRIGDTPVQTWQAFSSDIIHAVFKQDRTNIVIERDGQTKQLTLDLTQFTYPSTETNLVERVGFNLFRPKITPVIANVVAGSPADIIGLKAEDRVISFGDVPVDDWTTLVKMIEKKTDQPTAIGIIRDQTTQHYTITPKADPNDPEAVGKVGIQLKIDPAMANTLFQTIQFSPIDAIGYAWTRVSNDLTLTFRSLQQLLTGNLSVSNLSGPISIAGYANQAASQGLNAFLNFLGFLSINLCILNLLPIPVLDGGHLLYYVLEAIRGKPLSEKTQHIGQTIGFILLILLMILVSYNDITRH